MRALVILAVLVGTLAVSDVRAQTAADTTAIRQTALDYIEGWYEGNASRMERALHPDLAKRVVMPGPSGAVVQNMTKDQLVGATARGGGKMTPPDRQRKDVTILDIFGNAASVKVVAADWVDYLQIGKVDDRWVIINVLWELTEEAKARMQQRR
jgi:hypothetical protein